MWLLDLAWTEEDHSRKVAERRAQRGCAVQLRTASMFCFETAMWLFHWSALVRSAEVQGITTSIEACTAACHDAKYNDH